ncbi:hypothetical protein J6590_036638 [Homalodisca vitripennis]|nr:hypothetical protein J6590_036638 [Homalodisca vitripennis]
MPDTHEHFADSFCYQTELRTRAVSSSCSCQGPHLCLITDATLLYGVEALFSYIRAFGVHTAFQQVEFPIRLGFICVYRSPNGRSEIMKNSNSINETKPCRRPTRVLVIVGANNRPCVASRTPCTRRSSSIVLNPVPGYAFVRKVSVLTVLKRTENRSL